MAYINAAFRSSREYEVYFFMKDKYVRVYYTPGKLDDKILTSLQLISSGFPSLTASFFAEPGIDCSFDTEASEAYVFSTKYCAYIDYAPATTSDKILSGPTTIAKMFPSLKNTVFENGIDSHSGQPKEKKFTYSKAIGTIFESGIDACFASHEKSEAYLFKGEEYVRIKFTPDAYGDVLPGDVTPILDGWPCLKGILPVS
ncbi:hypothetical protein ACSQ67_015951 [Phaseolus vulgaris]